MLRALASAYPRNAILRACAPRVGKRVIKASAEDMRAWRRGWIPNISCKILRDFIHDLKWFYAGPEVMVDLVSAHKWFNLQPCAAMPMPGAPAWRSPTKCQTEIAEAQRQARKWLARH
jgi:hypothetical protein